MPLENSFSDKMQQGILRNLATFQDKTTFNLPDEIARRSERKAKIEKALAVIESRHEEKLAQERREYEEKVARRQAQRAEGTPPKKGVNLRNLHQRLTATRNTTLPTRKARS